jgi:hypothetical protein
MVNYSTNINKANNHLSPKESLNNDGQQFHQYQHCWPSLLKLSFHNKTEQYNQRLHVDYNYSSGQLLLYICSIGVIISIYSYK